MGWKARTPAQEHPKITHAEKDSRQTPSMGGDDEDWHVWDPIPELDQEDMVESDHELYDAQGWSELDLVKGAKEKLLQVQGPHEDAHQGHQAVSKLQDRSKITHAQRGNWRSCRASSSCFWHAQEDDHPLRRRHPGALL